MRPPYACDPPARTPCARVHGTEELRESWRTRWVAVLRILLAALLAADRVVKDVAVLRGWIGPYGPVEVRGRVHELLVVVVERVHLMQLAGPRHARNAGESPRHAREARTRDGSAHGLRSPEPNLLHELGRDVVTDIPAADVRCQGSVQCALGGGLILIGGP